MLACRLHETTCIDVHMCFDALLHACNIVDTNDLHGIYMCIIPAEINGRPGSPWRAVFTPPSSPSMPPLMSSSGLSGEERFVPPTPPLSGDAIGLVPAPLVALNMFTCVEPVGGRAVWRGLIGKLVVCMDLTSFSAVWPRARGAFGSWDQERI